MCVTQNLFDGIYGRSSANLIDMCPQTDYATNSVLCRTSHDKVTIQIQTPITEMVLHIVDEVIQSITTGHKRNRQMPRSRSSIRRVLSTTIIALREYSVDYRTYTAYNRQDSNLHLDPYADLALSIELLCDILYCIVMITHQSEISYITSDINAF